MLYRVPAAALSGLSPSPTADGRPALDLAWLETAAAVRPGLARLEAHQLAGERGNGPPPWQAWSSHVDDPWCTGAAEPAPAPTGTTHSVRMLYGPAGALAGADVGVVQLDQHVETIPSRQQVTGTAFGFNAPKARAPQAILLAVPPDVASPASTTDLVNIVVDARQLARARMATRADLNEVGPALPLPMLVGDGPNVDNSFGCDLQRVTP